jgi:WD40 repeat protein
MRHFRAGKGVVNALTFTPCGRTLHCVESKDFWEPHEAVHWLDVDRGQRARTLDLCEGAWKQALWYADDDITGYAFVSPNGNWVAVRRYVSDPIVLDLWRADTGAWSGVELSDSRFVVRGVCFAPASNSVVFASGTDGGGMDLIERMRIPSLERPPSLAFPDFWGNVLTLSRDESVLASLDFEFVVATPYDPARSTSEWVAVELEYSDRALLRFHPRSNELAIVDGDRVFLWDCQSPDAVPVPDVGDGITDLAFAPDGELWALGHTDGTVRLRTREREVARFDWGIGRVASVAFAPDGLTCAAGGENGRIVLWDVDV